MRAARVDRTQAEIVKALRKVGCRVALTHTLGSGFPDAVVACGNRLVLMEIKDGSLSPSKRRLTADEHRFHDLWRGHVLIISSVDEALAWVSNGQWQAPRAKGIA